MAIQTRGFGLIHNRKQLNEASPSKAEQEAFEDLNTEGKRVISYPNKKEIANSVYLGKGSYAHVEGNTVVYEKVGTFNKTESIRIPLNHFKMMKDALK